MWSDETVGASPARVLLPIDPDLILRHDWGACDTACAPSPGVARLAAPSPLAPRRRSSTPQPSGEARLLVEGPAPELRTFVDRVIVPTLLERFLRVKAAVSRPKGVGFPEPEVRR